MVQQVLKLEGMAMAPWGGGDRGLGVHTPHLPFWHTGVRVRSDRKTGADGTAGRNATQAPWTVTTLVVL